MDLSLIPTRRVRESGAVLLIAGCGLLLVGFLTTPHLVGSLFSPDGVLEYPVLKSLRVGKVVALGWGCVIAVLSLSVFFFPRFVLVVVDWLGRFVRRVVSSFMLAVVNWLGRFVRRAASSPRSVLLVLLLLIVVIGLGIRLHFYIGLVRTDSFWTTASAHSLVKGDGYFDYTTYYGRSRRILVYGTWLLFSLFGESEFVASLLPLVCSLGTIMLLFLIGRKLWTSRVGLIAAAIYALAAPDIALSSFLLPDPMMPFFLSGAMLLFLKGREQYRPWTKRGLFFGAGGVTALTFLVRENAPIAIGVFFVFWLLFERRQWRDYLVGAAGFVLVLALIMYGVRDDLALYFGKMFVDSTDAGAADVVRTYRHLGFLKILVSNPLYFPLYWPALISFVAGIRAAWRRRRDMFNGIGLVVVWFGWLYVYLDFIGRYVHGFGNIARYTSILLPPVALLLAWAIERLRNQDWIRKRRLIRAAAYFLLVGYLVFVVTSGYELLQRAQTQSHNVEYWWREPAQLLGNLEFRPTYFLGEQTWNKKMSFSLRYSWPDIPYYVQATRGEYVYVGVKPEYLGKVEILQEEFREWYRQYVMKDPDELASLGPKIYKIEDAYVLVNPNTLANLSLDYLIPEDWEVVRRFQDVGNWRERDRILYWAPQRKLPALSQAWVAEGIRLAEKGLLEDALARLRMAIMLDPTDQLARTVHEELRNQLLVTGSESDELDVALLRSGTRIEEIQGQVVNPLYSVAEALTLPRDNRWISGHYLYFEGENELPISITLNFGQSRRVHYVGIQWKEYPSIIGCCWDVFYDPGDGRWRLLDQVQAVENAPYAFLLPEPHGMQRLKLVITAVSEGQTTRGIRIEQIIAY